MSICKAHYVKTPNALTLRMSDELDYLFTWLNIRGHGTTTTGLLRNHSGQFVLVSSCYVIRLRSLNFCRMIYDTGLLFQFSVGRGVLGVSQSPQVVTLHACWSVHCKLQQCHCCLASGYRHNPTGPLSHSVPDFWQRAALDWLAFCL